VEERAQNIAVATSIIEEAGYFAKPDEDGDLIFKIEGVNASGECAGQFWPDAIKSARDGDDWLFYFDGSTIAEFARAA